MDITYSFELKEDNKLANKLAIPARAVEARVDLEAQVYGSYRPATWDFPAEYPELMVEEVSNLIVTFYEESQNLTFDLKVELTATEIDVLLEPHWADIETYLWEVYHDNQEWN